MKKKNALGAKKNTVQTQPIDQECCSCRQEEAADCTTPTKKSNKWPVKRKIFITVVSVVLVLILAGFFIFQYLFAGLKTKPIAVPPQELEIDSSVAEKSKEYKIINIALFGVDSRNYDKNDGRSDSIMILSVDQKNNTLKLTSILRDSKVRIAGHGEDKIAHAYAYGGPELAIKTLNDNFRLDIQDYATVNFAGLAHVIDAVGGIDIEITEAERKQININANSDGLHAELVKTSGRVHLNGAQATAYARIRNIDSDNARADRQKKVLACMLENVKTLSMTEYPNLLRTVLPLVETSLSYTDIIGFAPMLLNELPLVQNSIPSDADHAVGGGNPWVWKYDLDAAAKRLHAFIYEDDSSEGSAESISASSKEE